LDVARSRIENVQQAAVHSLGAGVRISESILGDVAACGEVADVVAVHAQPDPALQPGGVPMSASVVRSRLSGAARAALIGFGGVELCSQGVSMTAVGAELVAGVHEPYSAPSPVSVAEGDSCKPDASLQERDAVPGIFARDHEGEHINFIVGRGRLAGSKVLEGVEIWAQGRDAIPPVTSIASSAEDPDKDALWTHPWLPQQQAIRLSFADSNLHRILGVVAPMRTPAESYHEGTRPLPSPEFALIEGGAALGNRPLDLSMGAIAIHAHDENGLLLNWITVKVLEPLGGAVLYVHEDGYGNRILVTDGPTILASSITIVELPPGLTTISVEHASRECRAMSPSGELLTEHPVNRLTLHVLPVPAAQVYFKCTNP